MTTSDAVNDFTEASPRRKARIAGLFYLLTAVMGTASLFVEARLVVSGNAAATAANILARETMFRAGFAADLVATAAYVVVTALFYQLFKPAGRSVSLVATFFGLTGCMLGALSGLFRLAPIVVLRNAQSVSVFSAGQVQALAFDFVKLNAQAASIAFVFFGLYCLLIGYLAFRSTFLPRVVGVLMAAAGVAWLTNSFAAFLAPALAALMSPYILPVGALGEMTLTLWLLTAGVNAERWTARLMASRPRGAFERV